MEEKKITMTQCSPILLASTETKYQSDEAHPQTHGTNLC